MDASWPISRPNVRRGRSTCLLEPAYRSPRGHLWWWYRGFQQVVRRRSPHIVHVLSEPWGLLVTQALHHHRSGWSHIRATLSGARAYLEDAIRLSIARRNVRRLAGLAAENQQAIDRAHQNGLRSSAPVDLINTSPRSADAFDLVGAHHQANLRREWGLRPGIPVIGMCGRLVEAKGVRVLSIVPTAGSLRRTCLVTDSRKRPAGESCPEFASQYDDVVMHLLSINNRCRTSEGEERHVDLLAEWLPAAGVDISHPWTGESCRITRVRDHAQAPRRLQLPAAAASTRTSLPSTYVAPRRHATRKRVLRASRGFALYVEHRGAQPVTTEL